MHVADLCEALVTVVLLVRKCNTDKVAKALPMSWLGACLLPYTLNPRRIELRDSHLQVQIYSMDSTVTVTCIERTLPVNGAC